jgi:hypothetical protein
LLDNLVPYHNLIQHPLFAGLVFNHKLDWFGLLFMLAAAPSPASCRSFLRSFSSLNSLCF